MTAPKAPKIEVPLIHSRILAIMEGLGAITKDQTNPHHHYQFRGIDDVYNQLQPQLIKYGVTVLPIVQHIKTGSEGNQSFDRMMTGDGKTQLVTVCVNYIFTCADDGSSLVVSVLGEGADTQDKAVNKAMSSAYKNAMFQTFCIPVENIDSEREDPVDHGGRERPQPQRREPTPSATPPRSQEGGKKGLITQPQVKRLWGIALSAGEGLGVDRDAVLVKVGEMLSIRGYTDESGDPHVSTIERGAAYENIIEEIQGWTEQSFEAPGAEDSFE